MMLSVVMFMALFLCCTLADMEVTTSQVNTCASFDGQVKCWGSNSNGRLGLGISVYDYNGIPGMEYAAAPVEESINLGSDFSVEKVRCSYGHCCALSDLKGLKC